MKPREGLRISWSIQKREGKTRGKDIAPLKDRENEKNRKRDKHGEGIKPENRLKEMNRIEKKCLKDLEIDMSKHHKNAKSVASKRVELSKQTSLALMDAGFLVNDEESLKKAIAIKRDIDGKLSEILNGLSENVEVSALSKANAALLKEVRRRIDSLKGEKNANEKTMSDAKDLLLTLPALSHPGGDDVKNNEQPQEWEDLSGPLGDYLLEKFGPMRKANLAVDRFGMIASAIQTLPQLESDQKKSVLVAAALDTKKGLDKISESNGQIGKDAVQLNLLNFLEVYAFVEDEINEPSSDDGKAVQSTRVKKTDSVIKHENKYLGKLFKAFLEDADADREKVEKKLDDIISKAESDVRKNKGKENGALIALLNTAKKELLNSIDALNLDGEGEYGEEDEYE